MTAGAVAAVGPGLLEALPRAPSQRRSAYLAPVMLFYALFLLAPYVAMLAVSLHRYSSSSIYLPGWTAANYVNLLTDRFYLRLLGETIVLGVAVTLLTLLLAYPLALRIVRARPRLKSILLAIALSPLLINLVVRSYAWLVLLGDHGIINTWLMRIGAITAPLPINSNFVSVTIGLVHVGLPLMILSLVGIMERIDPDLLEAAESLGAGTLRVLRRVHVPLTLPGIGAGSLLVFCFTISAFVTPQLLGGHRFATIGTVIYERFTFSMNWPLGAALVFILLVINFAVILLHGRLFHEA